MVPELASSHFLVQRMGFGHASEMCLSGKLYSGREAHDLGLVAGRTDTTAVMYAGKIVEQASTPDIFKHMRMPYTHALMGAIPRLADPPHTRLQAIPGQPPSLVDPPGGCRFAPRCPRAAQRCVEQDPPLRNVNGSDHRFACWFPLR